MCPHCKLKTEVSHGKYGSYQTLEMPIWVSMKIIAEENDAALYIPGYWHCIYCGWVEYDKIKKDKIALEFEGMRIPRIRKVVSLKGFKFYEHKSARYLIEERRNNK